MLSRIELLLSHSFSAAMAEASLPPLDAHEAGFQPDMRNRAAPKILRSDRISAMPHGMPPVPHIQDASTRLDYRLTGPPERAGGVR
jgi:hypothetical protein